MEGPGTKVQRAHSSRLHPTYRFLSRCFVTQCHGHTEKEDRVELCSPSQGLGTYRVGAPCL